jgi:hypothetical protein
MISIQTGETPQEVRRYCKYTFGLVILVENHPDIAKRFRTMFKSLTYEDRLKAMDYIDVTSKFNVTQGSRYIESIINHYQDYELPDKQ